MSSRRSKSDRRTLVWLAAAIVVLVALGSSLFGAAYVRMLRQSFRDRSLAYAQAFAASALPWMERKETEMLRAASRLFLAGSARYVQIWTSDGLLIEERSAELVHIELPSAPPLMTPSSTPATVGGGSDSLEVQLPVGPEGTAGVLRIGIDRAPIAGQVAGAIAGTAGGAFAFAVALIGTLTLVFRRRQSPHISEREPSAPLPLRAGTLEVDRSRKRVSLAGEAVEVTPKQYMLLELLVSQPGRVFTEREILDAAWPDSPYADSKDIKQYIYLLRKRLGQVEPSAKGLIETVPGFGYRLAPCDVDQELTK